MWPQRCGLRGCGLGGVASGCGLGRCGLGGVASEVWPREVWPRRCGLGGGVATGLKTPEFKDNELWPKTFVLIEFKLTGSGVFLLFDSDHSVILWFFMV